MGLVSTIEFNEYKIKMEENKDFVCSELIGYVSGREARGPSQNITCGISRMTCTSPSYNSHPLMNLVDKMESMVSALSNISQIYSFIDVQSDDIFVTMNDTGEIYSVNQLVKDKRQLEK